MMRGLIKMASGRKRWFAPSLRMVIGIPSGSTEVEIRAVRDSAEHAGGREYIWFSNRWQPLSGSAWMCLLRKET